MTEAREPAFTPLAIIGIGCLFPRAADARAYWMNIKNGVDGIAPVPATHWNPADYLDPDPKSPDRTYASRGGFLDPVDFRPLDFGIAPNDLEATDTSQLLGLVAARQALQDAGYGADRTFDRNRVSVILGVTGTLELVIPLGARLGHPRWKKALENAGVPDVQAKQVMDEISDSYVGWQENSFPGLLGNVVAGRIANRLDLGGTNCVVDAACASSLSAIHLAGLELAAGRCDVAVSGGVDTFNDIFMYMCFSKTPALSPTGDAKPFDAAGDGTILGEGLGLVVLKRLADAERDGDRVYAVIRGLGSSSDGKGNAIYAPSSAGQVKALRNAYNLANISPDSIELVEGHGTGTRVGDAAEVGALREVYREARADGTWCAIGSVKSQIGHTKAAAGAAGLIKAALALHHQVLPPTLKVREPLEGLLPGKSPFYVNTEKRPWIAHPDHPRRAAVSAFGFGGSNFHCVLEEAATAEPVIDWSDDVEIVALSAMTLPELEKKLESFKDARPWARFQTDAATSRASFSSASAFRLLLVCPKEWAKLIDQARAKLRAEPDARFWRLPDGAYFGAGPALGKLAVLFPGQGSQYVGMLRDLACQFPAMRQVLAEADRVYTRWTGEADKSRLSERIYPFPAFRPEDREQQEADLKNTEVAQPAIGAVALGALKVVEQFGLQPEAYAGHSYGELPALCAAGCFDEAALHAMSRLRGHLMASYRGPDAGGMLAVHAPLDAIELMLREESLDLVVANRNSPVQSVLSGRHAEIDQAAVCLDRRQLRHTKLAVAAAFHSPLVASARVPFRDALQDLEFRPASRSVYANTSGRSYPQEPAAIRDQLADQLARPVDFVAEITEMAASGVRTFLEVGPGSTLTRLVGSILSNEQFPGWDACALDASHGKRAGAYDLAHALARIAAHGHPIDLTPWQKCPDRSPAIVEPSKPGFVVPISGANYVSPKAGKTRQIEETKRPAPTPSRPAAPASTLTKSMAPTTSPPLPLNSANGSVSADSLAQALQVTQQSLTAFQKLQEQTAQLHRQFLESQEAAQRTLQLLVEQQHTLLTGNVRPLPARITPVPPETRRQGDKETRRQENGKHEKGLFDSPRLPVPPAPVAYAPGSPKQAPESPKTAPQFDPTAILLSVIAEKTGYPVDMLAPEMALDADLGIDSIKRVEIFSALQEKLPDAPVVKPEHLGSLHTVRDVIAFLSTSGSSVAETPKAAPARPTNDVSAILLAVVAEKTGYPTDMLSAEMALDADLGIDSIKRVEIFSALQEKLPSAPIVKPEHLGTLHTLGDVIAFLSNGAPEPEPAAKKKSVAAETPPLPPPPDAKIERSVLRMNPFIPAGEAIKLAAGSSIAIVAESTPFTQALLKVISQAGFTPRLISWETAPSSEDVAGLILISPASTTELSLRAFRWIRQSSTSLRRTAERGGAFLATISFLNGTFGIGGLVDDRTVQGALAGLAKTAALEWPRLTCKAIDLAPNIPAAQVWEAITKPGPVEIGITAAGMKRLDQVSETIAVGEQRLSPKDVILVTGGARGVTAAVAQAIANQIKPTLVLLGRTEVDGPEPEWLKGCETEAAIKQAMARQFRPAPTPREIEAAYRRLVTRRESEFNIAAMREAGARIEYRSVDIADPAAVKRTLAEVRATIGPVTALIHGAGVLADRRINDLTDEQFQQVAATKVSGLETLLKVLAADPLKALVLFSSSTARFGRVGQAAYAAANETLNKIAQRESLKRPGCVVRSLNWGPWDGGMVTPALRKLFAQEGVGVIPLHQGAAIVLDELASTTTDVEVVYIARPDASAGNPALHQVFDRDVRLDDHPILLSHVIDGRAVVPLALHLEWLAHAALHASPGLVFQGVNDLRVLHGVTLDEGRSIVVQAWAGATVKEAGSFRIPVELRSKQGTRDVVHSRAEIVLTTKLAEPPAPVADLALEPYPRTIDEVYEEILFHGPDLAALDEIEGCDRTGITSVSRSAPAPTSWMTQPLRNAWITDPLAIDGAFQLMIVWSRAVSSAGCLPCLVGRYRQYRRAFPVGPIRIRARITKTTGAIVRADIDFLDENGALVAQMTDQENVIDEKLNRSFRRNRLVEGGVGR